MIDNILQNRQFRRYFPPAAAVLFIAVFVALGFWQLDRAAQKKELLAQFASGDGYMPLDGRLPEKPFQPIEARGQFEGERQVFIENIVRDGQIGRFVITPLRLAGAEALLLVNRGWVPGSNRNDTIARIDVADNVRRVRGRAGHLPRVSVRPGEAFDDAGDWPKSATYPTLDEVAAQLDAELQPVVLLLDPAEDDGFQRQWQPQQSGPMTNYSYAFQWFAMATAVLVILVWRMKKRVAAYDKKG